MPSEMTLHERLTKVNEAAIRREKLGELVSRMMVPIDDLAAIERDMLAPWRERVAALERENGELRAKKSELISKSSGFELVLNTANHTIRQLRAQHGALKARADALREAGEALRHEAETEQEGMQLGSAEDYEISEIIADWMVAARTYDAAGRAGETQDGNLVLDWSRITRSVDSVATDRQPDGLAAPSPTDAGAETPYTIEQYNIDSFNAFFRDTKERLAALERWAADTSNELASIREWHAGHQERLDALERWHDGVEKELDTLTDDLVADRKKIESLEQRLDSLRGPEVVTDEMIDAAVKSLKEKPWGSMGIEEIAGRCIRAVFALRAGKGN